MSATVTAFPGSVLCRCGMAAGSIPIPGRMACEACAAEYERDHIASATKMLTLPPTESEPLASVLARIIGERA